jgi:hypothetical protein
VPWIIFVKTAEAYKPAKWRLHMSWTYFEVFPLATQHKIWLRRKNIERRSKMALAHVMNVFWSISVGNTTQNMIKAKKYWKKKQNSVSTCNERILKYFRWQYNTKYD